MHAETIAAAQWWAQPRGATSASWIANYQHSVNSRQRQAIVRIVQTLQAETVLEVGCHCGPNLIALARACPDLHGIGIDVNAEAITAATTWAEAEGFSNRLTFRCAPCPTGTHALPTGSVDVAITCYTLAYIAPGDLPDVLYELGRLSSKAVILAEPMGTEGKSRETAGGYTEWTHDYAAAIEWVGSLRDWTIQIVPIDPPVDRLNAIGVVSRDVSGIVLNTP